jgi:hypothetical protein
VPLLIDKRAAADQSGRPKVTALADEILDANPNAIVIANGIEGSNPRIKTFQRAKGLNDLDENDIFLIATCLSPEHYAVLNAIGQWLELPDVIVQHYADQIAQAAGRNTGFRKSEKPTKTVLICSNRLAKSALKHCFQGSSARVRLVRSTQKVL